MKITILSFGIAKEIIGQRFLEWEADEPGTVGQLRATLAQNYPALAALASLRFARNGEYVDDGTALAPHDEVVLIPPVSGG